MAKRYGNRTLLCYDHGAFLELAVALSKDFGRVLYYSPWESAYPRSNAARIGEGIPGIERVRSPWDYYDEIDCWAFPDVYEGDLQQFLVNQGKRVWGARQGEFLELDREQSKEHSKKLGIDVGNYEVVTGLDALRDYLKTHKDVYVKLSTFRGDCETFHAPDLAHVEEVLTKLQRDLGAKSKIMEFIVEDAINNAIEIGYDGSCIDGKFPTNALLGVEVKDKAYVGKTMRYAALPERVRAVNEKLAPTLKKLGYRGFISSEVRCTEDGKAYLIDPCTRLASPPGEIYPLLISNLAEIIWEGADGIVVEPEYTAKYAAMVMMLSDWADSNWQQVSFPPEIREHVRLRNFTIIDGNFYVIPLWTGMPEIGGVVAVGDTAKEAIEECKRIAEQVEGYSIEKPIEALEGGANDLKELIGAEPAPPKKIEREAEPLRKAGKISERAYEKMVAKAT